MSNVRMHLIIEGRVQGVCFRDSTRRQALALGVSGWVKNRFDGTVEIIAEGPDKKVKELILWCRRGPSYARVQRIHEKSEEWVGEFNSFDIVF
ncbi:MAG: acylphosphatase [Deltaproteobacteria bacterium]|nr:acylphosphatase [Deltaproteobacteria bacterium]